MTLDEPNPYGVNEFDSVRERKKIRKMYASNSVVTTPSPVIFSGAFVRAVTTPGV